MSRNADEWLVLGRIRGVFGVKGFVRVESYADQPESIIEYARWRVSTRSGHIFLCPHEGRWHGPGLVVQLATPEGGLIDDRDVAATYVGALISVPRAGLPVLGPDEVYWTDLVGMTVVGADDVVFGVVKEVLDNPAHPILELDTTPPLLIPFVRGPIIEDVNSETRVIRTLWSADYAV